MIVIDHNDLGKTKTEVLMDLIYESTGQRFPLDKITFYTPREVRTRPGDPLYPNTHIPIFVDVGFDRRYALPESGFMYRRREIAEHLQNVNWDEVLIPHFPIYVHELVEQINTQLDYPIKECEIANLHYDSIEQMKLYGLIIQADAESVLWCGSSTTFGANFGNLEGDPMLSVTRLDGFNKWELPVS